MYIVTLFSGVIILILVTFEIYRYITPEMHPEIVVDSGKMVSFLLIKWEAIILSLFLLLAL